MCSISPESLGDCQADDCAGRWCVTSWHGELKQIVEVYLSIWWTWWNVSMATLVLTQWLEIFEAFVDQYYATVIKNKIHKSCLSGEWIGGESSGGCRNFLETFIHNPQFSVRVWLWCKSAEQILHAKNAWLWLCHNSLSGDPCGHWRGRWWPPLHPYCVSYTGLKSKVKVNVGFMFCFVFPFHVLFCIPLQRPNLRKADESWGTKVQECSQ